MKVGVITDINKAKVMEINRPEVSKGEILVKVEACALCTFEQRIFNGTKKVSLPYLGGHEIAGRVFELGEGVNPKWKIGQRVAVRTLDQCGECRYCQMGETTMCEMIGKSGRHVPEFDGIGGLAEYYLAKPHMLFPLKEDLAPEVAALTEPLACVIHSIDLAQIDFGDAVVILGAGIMGLLHLQLAKLRGARVIVSEVDSYRREKACSLGATDVINPIEVDLVDKIKELTDGYGADVVICTPSISKLAEQSVEMVSNLGKVVLYGSFHPDTPLSLSPNRIHYSQIKLIGAVNPGSKDFLRATRMLNQGIVDLNGYVDAIFPLEQIQEAYDDSVIPGRYRVVVTMDYSISKS